ncbi:MAG: HD domain-containing protein [Candidatus Heimdallarchaeota archaeon]|nr:HD domain-containing protein [Candidatus Heimdallarchaeota archaeon]MCK5049038.1 HD domain-containing protein [Candidatus Heimdallarchaeota archaeon]
MNEMFSLEKSEQINYLVSRMKDLLRQGWIGKVPTSNIESLADHSFGVAMWTYVLGTLEREINQEAKENLNVEKAVVKALFHDVHESLFLDMDRSIQKALGEEGTKLKNEIEGKLENKLVQILAECLAKKAEEVTEDLYSGNETLENELVRLADKVDLMFQVRNYRERGWLSKASVKEFLEHRKELFSGSKLQIAKLLEEILD